MRKNAMHKNLRQSILNSLGRYIAIILIIALGSGIFVGLIMTKSDMVATGQKFMDQQQMFDLRLASSYGWDKDQIGDVSALPGVEAAEGMIFLDAIAGISGMKDDVVFRFYSIPERINRVSLEGGRMPVRSDECLIDGYIATDDILGATVTISESNAQDTLDSLVHHTYTIVGYVATPLYMDMNRGTTSIGSGSLETYLYLPADGFDVDYYPEIHVTLQGDYQVYTDEYNDAMQDAAERLEPLLEPLAQDRFQSVKADAIQAYHDGMLEYFKGLKEFHEGEAEAKSELEKAYQELSDAEKAIIEAEKGIAMGTHQLNNAKNQLVAAQKELNAGKQEFEEQAAPLYEPIRQTMEFLRSEQARYQQKVAELEGRIAGIKAQLAGLSWSVTDLEKRIVLELELTGLELEASSQRQGLAAANLSICSMLPLEEPFTTILAQLEDGQRQIDSGWTQIIANEKKMEEARLELEKGEKELEEGWKEYWKGKAEADRELEEARIKLSDAKAELDDARKQIQDMKQPSLYVLDRNSNTGYCSLDSSSDIVQGVSRVFPAFFLLVASLVCITTMTRMIDEERTQIGTLKALGYSNGSIISKYLIYAGSGAVIGCGLGVLVGSVVFPMILWEAYKIMLYITDAIVLKFNWWLCAAIVGAYTLVMLVVTWYCCRRALSEQPAELIRPKAPDPGKKILLERLKLWNHVSFLNKVTIRNIFRYRQRLAMMMVGIGGCTALLLTGFGLRDSITNVVNYQFGEVTVYDLQVYFENSQTEEDMLQFRDDLGSGNGDVLFYHQESVELDFDNVTKELYLMVSEDEIMDFIDYHSGKTALKMPGLNEALMSVGAAEAMGIQVGDEIQLRNADMETMTVTVSGIYDNHVYNYVLIQPETVQAQLGRSPELQMALVRAADGQDPHELSAKISGFRSVMNVSVSEDLADMVNNMMKALDLVVWVIVFCAGLLAVTVLYNLTNININERIREIATIKVLGFNAGETGAYVFKENLSLTAVGSVLGLGLGYGLLLFVMSQIKIDMVWFKALIEPKSYVLSLVLTVVAACIVDYVFYFKLDKINMAEALKSVE